MKAYLIFLLLLINHVTLLPAQIVRVGTTGQPSSLKINHPSDSAAMIWDNGDARWMGAQDALVWNRAKLRFLLDADNDNGGTSQFSLFSDVTAGNNTDAPVNFNLSGGKSWIDSGNLGIGNKNPSQPLEVSGIIYSSSGGIQFPDQTVQITACLNSDPATNALPKLIGLLIVDTIPGTLDTTLTFPLGGSFNVSGFPIYAAHMDVVRSSPPGTGSQLIFDAIKVTTDISEHSPFFFEKIITSQAFDNVSLFFIQDGPPGLQAHYSIQLENVGINLCENQIQSAGAGKYAHFQVLGFYYNKITWKSHTNPANQFCWDLSLEMACGGGG